MSVPARRWLSVLGMLLMAWFIHHRSRGSAPAPVEGTPAASFSAQRAVASQLWILDDASPRISGSEGTARALVRLQEELEPLKVDLTRHLACDPRGYCGWNHELLASFEGTGTEASPIIVTAHVDTVPISPGAADDGHALGVISELARNLQAEPTKRDVWFLVTDGEEIGLLGARSFAQRFAPLGPMINLEARGSAGSSMLFETSMGNQRMVQAWLAEAPHPELHSLSVDLYRRMPNDTDMSVYLQQGWKGLNFAFIGNGWTYHTVDDTAGRLSLRSVQHQGDNALAAIRALDTLTDEEMEADDDLVAWSIAGLLTPRWPARWSLGISLGVTGLVILALIRIRPKKVWQSAWRGVAWLVATGALWFVMDWLRTLFWPVGEPHASMYLLTMVPTGLALALALRPADDPLHPRVPGAMLLLFLQVTAGLVAGWYWPSASPLFLIPAGLAAIVLLIWPRHKGAVATTLAFASALLWFELLISVGRAYPPGPDSAFRWVALLAGLWLVPWLWSLPLAFRLPPASTLTVIGIATLLHMAPPGHNSPLNLRLLQYDSGSTWQVSGPPRTVKAIRADLDPAPRSTEPLTTRLQAEGRRVLVTPPADAHQLWLTFRQDGLQSVRVGDQVVQSPRPIDGRSREGTGQVEVRLQLPWQGPLELELVGVDAAGTEVEISEVFLRPDYGPAYLPTDAPVTPYGSGHRRIQRGSTSL